jgi:hypothetical protein
MTKIIKTCKNCIHWKNQQAELNYNTFQGICTSINLRFNTQYSCAATVLDRENKSSNYTGTHRFENQNSEIPIGKPEKSRYCFVTDEDFGCVNFDEK